MTIMSLRNIKSIYNNIYREFPNSGIFFVIVSRLVSSGFAPAKVPWRVCAFGLLQGALRVNFFCGLNASLPEGVAGLTEN
jgi:hypothetical protein